MSEWKEYRLSEIIELTGGGTPKTNNNVYWNGDIPWLSVVDFNNGRKYVYNTEKTITKSGLDNSSTKLLNTGDIIISARGTVGVVSMLGKPMTFNQSCYGIKAIEGVSINDFVYYLLKDTVSNFIQIAHGGVFDTITSDTFKEIEISLPPLPEQKAIASILSSLDDKIDLLHRQNATLEKMAETLFRQWFMEEAKEEWEMGNIEDLATHLKTSVQPQKNPQVEFRHYSIPAFDDSKKPVVEFGQDIQSNKYLVPQNCILFSKLNPHRDKRIWLLQDEVAENSICSTEFQIVKPKKDLYLYFLYGWISCTENYNEIASGIGGTSGSHQRIDPATIFSLQCPIVPEKFVATFNTKIQALFKKQVTNQIQIRTLTTLRDTLLPKLMNGEVRVAVSKN